MRLVEIFSGGAVRKTVWRKRGDTLTQERVEQAAEARPNVRSYIEVKEAPNAEPRLQ